MLTVIKADNGYVGVHFTFPLVFSMCDNIHKKFILKKLRMGSQLKAWIFFLP